MRTRLDFEGVFGADARGSYNASSVARAARTRKIVVGHLGGFSDLFVPIVAAGRTRACLVSGAFRTEPVSAREIAVQWEELTGRRLHPTDPDLLAYARTAVGSVLLDPPLYRACVVLLSRLAAILVGAADAEASVRRFATRYGRVFAGSHVAMWGLSQGLVERGWGLRAQVPKVAPQYAAFGVDSAFTHVLAISFDAREQNRDPVERLVRGFALQRHCASVAGELRAISGKLGDHGAFLLTKCAVRGARATLDAVAERIRDSVHRRFDTRPNIGISSRAPNGQAIPACHDQAALALQWAQQGTHSVVFFADRGSAALHPERSMVHAGIAELRRAVARGTSGSTDAAARVVAREVTWRARGSVDAARAWFEGLVAEVLGAVEERGILDARSLRLLEASALIRLRQAASLATLSDAFEQCVAEFARSAHSPVVGSRVARLEGARRLIERNLHKALTRDAVAHEAGFAPRYFSSLFKQRYGVGFERYLRTRRLERACELLRTTELPMARISRDAGFGSDVYFFIAFKRAYGRTPGQYRRQAPGA
jgi:AraC-like DNA-binding protein